MANRTWRNESNNRSYMYGSSYGAPISYNQNLYNDRRTFSNRGGYQDDMKRGKRPYDAVDISPKKPIRDNNQGSFRRGYNAQAAPQLKKSIAKYSVRPPKVTFDLKEASLSMIKSRYPKMYVPSDFFHSDFRWQGVFPLHTPLDLSHKTNFHTFHRDVEPLTPFDNTRLEPADVNYTYSAKVMLLESINLLKSVCEVGGTDTKSIYKSLNFLVGTKSKNEPLAIGGPWSPSLDGLKPDEDPQVLINTAIRTCKELTAIDLTPCKDWYRFIEYHYYRPADRQGLNISNENDENRTENENNFRVETVVIFVPSIWDCMPDEDSWEDMKTSYSMALEAIISPPIPEPSIEIMDSEDKKDDVDFSVDVPLEDSMKEEISEAAKEDTKEADESEVLKEVKAAEPTNEIKKLTENEKKRLEGLYKMNDTSSIVFHPNKAAKNGKFHCQFMPLSNLLEYRTDDQKEHTFEVSMFAEQFQEMLHRDAAFNIYKSFMRIPKQADLDKHENEPEVKKTRVDKEAQAATTKDVTQTDSELLYSFCTFDTDHADFIKEYDLEDIIHSIGLGLSRSQVKKLINKAINRKGCVHYRELNFPSTEDEGSSEDLISDVDLGKGNRPKLIKLSDENTLYLDTSKATTEKIRHIEVQIKEIVSQFNEAKVELENERKVFHLTKDVENSLRAQLKKLETELYNERKTVREVSQAQGAYNNLLTMARDVLERAKAKIDRQFERDHPKDEHKPNSASALLKAN